MPISLIIVDDHPIVIRGIRGLLEEEPDLQVVAEASNGMDAIRLVEQLKPDLLILDMSMPGMHGLDVIHRVVVLSPQTKILVLSVFATEPYVVEALKGGAMAYLMKESAPAEIVAAIREVLQGRRFLSAPLSEMVIKTFVNRDDAARESELSLTPREREVIRLTADGFNNIQIGSYLSISPRTVEVHRSNIMKKLGLNNQGELIRYTLRHNLLDDSNETT